MKRKAAVLILISGLAQILCAQSRDMLEKIQMVSSAEEAELLVTEIQGSKGPDKDLYLGILYHNMVLFAQVGDNTYLEKALKYNQASYEKTHNPLSLGYWGSAITLEAGAAVNKNDVLTASIKLEKGSKLIDQAVQEDSSSVGLRLLRMNNGVEVSESSPFDRYDVVKEDLEYIRPLYTTLANNVKSMVKLIEGRLALHEDRIDHALSCFEQSIREMPGSSYARLAESYLEELEE